MGMSEMQAQCWICPHCFDDHATNADCKESDLKETVDYLKQENDELKRKLELAKNQRDAWIGECYKEDFGLREYTINKANEALKSIRGS